MSKLLLVEQIITTAAIAKLLSTPDKPVETEWVRRWLTREGVLVKRGGRYVTTLSRLTSVFSNAFRRIQKT